jgi:hypothetical protein
LLRRIPTTGAFIARTSVTCKWCTCTNMGRLSFPANCR